MIDFWKERSWFGKTLIVVILIILLAAITPFGRSVWNRWFFNVHKASDITSYATIKKVEDTCRSMISSYVSDKMVWEQFKNSENEEQRGWADNAQMRANKTAASYNEYILKNGFVWSDNVPYDIREKLEYLK